MGSVTSTTRAIASLFGGEEDIATRLRRVFTPCPRGDGLKTINVRIFDEHVLVTEMATSQEIVNGLQAFLDGMHSSPGLEPAVTAGLSAINFQVTYTAADPTKNVINNFRHRDFPIYRVAHTGGVASPKEEIVSLLVAHRIPATTFVAQRRAGFPNPVMAPVLPYKDIETDWTEERTVLGFGMPGLYFVPNSQSTCRKVGIIKMRDFMTENVSPPNLKAKLLSVIEHELGHMFGLVHEANTLMDGDYRINSQFTQYTNDQLWVVSRALGVLTRP